VTTKDIFRAKVGFLSQVDFKNIKESLRSFLQPNSIKTNISRPTGQVLGDKSKHKALFNNSPHMACKSIKMVQNLTSFSKYK